MSKLHRRSLLHAALALAAMPMIGSHPANASPTENESQQKGADRAMSKDIVMLHGANAGGWCFDAFGKVFEGEVGKVRHGRSLSGGCPWTRRKRHWEDFRRAGRSWGQEARRGQAG